MSAMQPVSQRDPEPEYLSFDGTADYVDGRMELRPSDDDRIVLHFRPADVRTQANGSVGVRLGARALMIDVPENPLVPVSDKGVKHWSCTGGTMCLGRVELCCDDRKTVGSCGGSWRCPP